MSWRCVRLGPGFDDRVDDRPRMFDLVGAREQRCITLQGVEDERLVGVRRVDAEGRAVLEVHRDRAHVESEARDLRPEAKHDALVGLDADREQVGVGLVAGRREQPVWHLAELDGDLGRALREPLARPDVDRHA